MIVLLNDGTTIECGYINVKGGVQLEIREKENGQIKRVIDALEVKDIVEQ